MLESINDYIALIAIILIIALVICAALYMANINKIRKNVRKEMTYYHYDQAKLTSNNKKDEILDEIK